MLKSLKPYCGNLHYLETRVVSSILKQWPPTLLLEIYPPAGFTSNRNRTSLLVDQELLKAVIRWSGGHDDGWN